MKKSREPLSLIHIFLASGLTIAGAILCLSVTRMPYIQTMGVPCAVGMLVAVAIALTLVPAVLAVGSGFCLFDPKRKMCIRDSSIPPEEFAQNVNPEKPGSASDSPMH